LAGLTAALRAVEAGLHVKVIAKGMGSLHWATGAIDLLGYVGVEDRAVTSPWARMARTRRRTSVSATGRGAHPPGADMVPAKRGCTAIGLHRQ
jgi:thioredoxin reductase